MAFITSRVHTHKKYKDAFEMLEDNRQMDTICKKDDGFQLQVQQKFLEKWMIDHFNEYKHLLAYHMLGSGKTCTAITMAEIYMRLLYFSFNFGTPRCFRR